MPLQTVLTEIERLKQELDSHHPIPNDRLQKINYKFRLEWNYHSNKMEGGTLTFEETRSVMMEQLEIHGKPLRDVIEMRGHDEIIKNIQKIGRGEVRLTENRIREIHKTIIFEDEDKPGRFKDRNNYIYNYQGERFDFTPQEDTISAVNTLTNWLENELNAIKKNKSKKSIPEIAFEYHLRFLTIHPFLDGNGRTGRILMNLILISYGYPPIIIRTDDKELYNKRIAHAQQYEENPLPLYEMLGNLLIRSFEICIKGAKGESIFELEDWEKRLQLLEFQSLTNEEIVKSIDNVYAVLKNTVVPLIDYAAIKFSAFDRLFSKKTISNSLKLDEEIIFNINNLSQTIETLKETNQIATLDYINFTFQWIDFKSSPNVQDIALSLQINFNDKFFEIKTEPIFTENRYDEPMLYADIKEFVNKIGSLITNKIEKELM